MAIVSMLVKKVFGGRQGLEFRKPGFPDTVGFIFDATVSYSHEDTSEPTENPVEEGAPITDHVDVKPAELTLKVVHSETPISFLNQIGGLASAVAGTFADKKSGPFAGAVASAGAGALFGVLTSSSGSNVKKAYDYLIDTQKKRIPFTVITGLRKYDNMIITSCSVNKDVKTGEALDATIKLKEIRLVKNQRVFVSNSVVEASARQRIGKKQAEEASSKKASFARTAFRALGGG